MASTFPVMLRQLEMADRAVAHTRLLLERGAAPAERAQLDLLRADAEQLEARVSMLVSECIDLDATFRIVR